MTPGQNSTLNFDPNPRSQFKVESWLGVTIQRWIQTWGRDSTWDQDLGHNSTWNHDPVSISTWNIDLGHNSTWNYDPGSHFDVELWPGVTIQRGIMTPGQNSTLNYDPGQNSALNCDPNPGSQFNVESWLGVKIQRGIMTWVHNSTWNQDPGSQFNRGPNFIRLTRGSWFNMKNPLNPAHSPLNQDPTGRNSIDQNSILHRNNPDSVRLSSVKLMLCASRVWRSVHTYTSKVMRGILQSLLLDSQK